MSSSTSPKTTGQMTLHVTLRIDPSNIEPFMEALRPCWQGCLREPECIFFDVFHSPTEPGTFRFVEVWKRDQKWFEEHQLTKPYYEPYLTITKPMWIADREMLFTERVDGWSYADAEYLQGALAKA